MLCARRESIALTMTGIAETLPSRHCEERSEEAIQGPLTLS
jgi:hypothetical protein